MSILSKINGPFAKIAAATICTLSASFTFAADSECAFLDYTNIQTPSANTTAERWRLKTHLVAEDHGDPCELEVLAESNIDELYNTASLNKKMTAVIAWDEINAGRLALDEELIISDWAYEQSSQRTEKTTITVREAIRAMMVGSSNDAATTLAARIASGKNQKWDKDDLIEWERKFAAEKMTAKAHALGMKNTEYRNATGLDEPLGDDKMIAGVRYYQNPLSVSTPREQAFLSSYIRNNYPEIVADSALPKIYLQNTRTPYENMRVSNTNRLLVGSPRKDADPIEEVIGLKTGGLTASGANQSTIAEFNIQGQKHYLIVETSGDSKNEEFRTSALARNATIHQLMDDGKQTLNDKYSTQPVSVASAYSAHPTR